MEQRNLKNKKITLKKWKKFKKNKPKNFIVKKNLHKKLNYFKNCENLVIFFCVSSNNFDPRSVIFDLLMYR